MVAEVVKHWHLPLGEVRRWTWRRLQAAHRQVRREQYDERIAQAQAVEAGYIRATIATHGKQVQPYKTYDQVMDDPWAPVEIEPEDEIWTIYRDQNELE
jgi:hypothetical protein